MVLGEQLNARCGRSLLMSRNVACSSWDRSADAVHLLLRALADADFEFPDDGDSDDETLADQSKVRSPLIATRA